MRFLLMSTATLLMISCPVAEGPPMVDSTPVPGFMVEFLARRGTGDSRQRLEVSLSQLYRSLTRDYGSELSRQIIEEDYLP